MSDVIARVEQKALEGISPSMPYTQGRLFKTGKNVIFEESSVQPIPGEILLVPKLANDPVLGISEHRKEDGTKQLYWGTPSKLYKWNSAGGTTQEGTGYTGIYTQTDTARVSHWSFAPFSNWIIATNGKDNAQIDKNAGAGFVALGGATFTWAQLVKKMGPYLLALNTSNGTKLIEWSDEDNPESWTPAAGSAAGNLPLRDLESDIVAAEWLGSMLAVYGTDSASGLSLVGGDLIFASRKLLRGIGAVGKHAVVAVGQLNYGFGQRSLWVTDGNEYKHLDNPEIHETVWEDMNQEQISKAVVWYDKLLDHVYFWWPQAGQANNSKAVIFNRRLSNWSILDFGRSAAAESSIFPYGITGSVNGDIFGQSVLNAPPGTQGTPVVCDPTANLVSGYGEGGYGEGGYGGEWTVDG